MERLLLVSLIVTFLGNFSYEIPSGFLEQGAKKMKWWSGDLMQLISVPVWISDSHTKGRVILVGWLPGLAINSTSLTESCSSLKFMQVEFTLLWDSFCNGLVKLPHWREREVGFVSLYFGKVETKDVLGYHTYCTQLIETLLKIVTYLLHQHGSELCYSLTAQCVLCLLTSYDSLFCIASSSMMCFPYDIPFIAFLTTLHDKTIINYFSVFKSNQTVKKAAISLLSLCFSFNVSLKVNN